MPMSNCCRYALVSIGSTILICGSVVMITMALVVRFVLNDNYNYCYGGYPYGRYCYQSEKLTEENLVISTILLSLSPIPIVSTFIMIWFCCCHRQRVSNCAFDIYFFFFIFFFEAGFGVMVGLGILGLSDEFVGVATGVALLCLSIIPLSVAVGFPLYYCRRRHKFIQKDEDEVNQTDEGERISTNLTESNSPIGNATSPFSRELPQNKGEMKPVEIDVTDNASPSTK